MTTTMSTQLEIGQAAVVEDLDEAARLLSRASKLVAQHSGFHRGLRYYSQSLHTDHLGLRLFARRLNPTPKETCRT